MVNWVEIGAFRPVARRNSVGRNLCSLGNNSRKSKGTSCLDSQISPLPKTPRDDLYLRRITFKFGSTRVQQRVKINRETTPWRKLVVFRVGWESCPSRIVYTKEMGQQHQNRCLIDRKNLLAPHAPFARFIDVHKPCSSFCCCPVDFVCVYTLQRRSSSRHIGSVYLLASELGRLLDKREQDGQLAVSAN